MKIIKSIILFIIFSAFNLTIAKVTANTDPQTPILFLGVYDASQGDYKYLPKIAKTASGWGSSQEAINILQNSHYKKSMNIKFKKEYQQLGQNKLDTSLRMGFFSINTHHYFRTYAKDIKQVWTTMKLTWTEVGSAADRLALDESSDEDDNTSNVRIMEILNTQSIITTGNSDITDKNKGSILRRLYKKQFTKTMQKLMKSILSYRVDGSGENIYFMVDKFKIGKKAKKLISRYRDKTGKLSEQDFMLALEISLRNSLNKHLNPYRKGKILSNIVLLPSKHEIKKLSSHWLDYADRYKHISGNSSGEIKAVFKLVKSINKTPVCNYNAMQNTEKSVPGYWIQAVLSKFYNKKIEEDAEDESWQIRSVSVGQIVMPITNKNSLAAPNPKYKKKKQRSVGTSVLSYLIPRDKDYHSNDKLDKYEKALDQSIDEMAKDLALKVKQTVQLRGDLDFETLCPESE